jgi:O-antigen biosynthesis protein WbqP
VIRTFDILISFLGLLILSPLLLILIILGYFDTGSPLLLQTRVGKDKQKFKLLKFRSMYLDTPSVATHLASTLSVTTYGSFLRKCKLDELPQLWNVFVGDMSLVGPRPNLLNQEDLIKERDSLGVYSIRPGITGLAQISQIDMSTPRLLAETDSMMINDLNIYKYFKYIFITIFGGGYGDRIIK